MSRICTLGGVYKVCPTCGKEFYIPNLDEWVFKRHGKNNYRFFCKWSCLRKFDETHVRKLWVK